MDLCVQTARDAFQQCACNQCLDLVTTCATDRACIGAMDCAISQRCVNCPQWFSSCPGWQGTSPFADKLIECMNTYCITP